MKDFKPRVALCALSALFIGVSSLMIPSRPDIFALERYIRSRNKTTQRALIDSLQQKETLDFVAIANRFGYPAKEYRVTTIDGYKLRIHRIPGSPSRPKAANKPVVLLMHGLVGSSDMWILLGPESNLAYQLVDMGYDVWLGNARGNTYSRSHVTLSPNKDRQFWDYSFHEIGIYDLPAIIDFVLDATNQRSISYVGHSMGTTVSYVLLSTKPEYNEKLNLIVSLSPVAFWRSPHSPIISFINKHYNFLKNIFESAGIYEILPLSKLNIQLTRGFCDEDSIFQKLCINFIHTSFGNDPNQWNNTIMSTLMSYFPASSSLKTYDHFQQHVSSGNFSMYDYGIIRNFAVYKQIEAPNYNLSNIVSPVALIYSEGDRLIPMQNAIYLSTKLPNVLTIEAVPDLLFGHMDFIYSRNVKTLLNDRVMEIITNIT